MKFVTALLILTVGIVAGVYSARANGSGCISDASATDLHFDSTLTCFTRDSSALLLNTGTEPLIVTEVIIVVQDGGSFIIREPRLPDTLNPGETLRVAVTFSPLSPGSFNATITYQVHGLDGVPFASDYISHLTCDGYIYEVNTTIARDYSIFPGAHLTLPIVVDTIPGDAYITKLSIKLEFDSAVITLHNLLSDRNYRLFAGGLLERWAVTVSQFNGNSAVIELIAPPGQRLAGRGALLQLVFIARYANGKTSEIGVTITAVDRPCVIFKTASGMATLESLATLGLLLEPNMTTNNQIGMYLFAGDPAIITAEVFASDGTLVKSLIDHQAYSSGKYTSNISTEGLAPGMYFLVLGSERERFIERFIVLK